MKRESNTTERDMHPTELSQSDNHLYIQYKVCQDEFPNRAEVLVITSYPPRECGIATYSQDLVKALTNQFSNSFTIKICALESENSNQNYPDEVKYILNTSITKDYNRLANTINQDWRIRVVLIQHEFGLFNDQEQTFFEFLSKLIKPVIIVFHTVLPHPDIQLKLKVQLISDRSTSIIVMTNNSAEILIREYGVSPQKITVIAHGTHLVQHSDKESLKLKYGLNDRKILTTFGLLSSGKGIETTLEALPAIIEQCPETIFLVIGKTHPGVVKMDGEKYREMLEDKVKQDHLQNNVRFINKYLGLTELLEYLQLTDIYLFTSTDPNQAVSGTFAYAMSCACPIISTPIPHAMELLTEETGIIFDFRNEHQLSEAVIRLMKDDQLRRKISFNTLQKIVSTAWENSAIAHAIVFEKVSREKIKLIYNLPEINLDHLKHLTTEIGIMHLSKIYQPEVSTVYTLEDNARALVSMCMYFKLTGDKESLNLIQRYLSFIYYCQQTGGDFLNYVGQDYEFSAQNNTVDLDDANGVAIWALGYLNSQMNLLPLKFTMMANIIFEKSRHSWSSIHSARGMAFAIKGIYYHHDTLKYSENIVLLKTFADRLVQIYKHESTAGLDWFDGYPIYANSILPEAILYAWILTGDEIYKEIAVSSMEFLLRHTFKESGIGVAPHEKWMIKGEGIGRFSENPIDVAEIVMTLSLFYDVFKDKRYLLNMEIAFNWFLGYNRLHQTVYNSCTGGCYNGLEKEHVNLNQGAESTVCYLMARLIIEKYKHVDHSFALQYPNNSTLNPLSKMQNANRG